MLIAVLFCAILQVPATLASLPQGNEANGLSEMRILPLEHSSAAELRGVIGPFLNRGETLQADERTNSLILSSSAGRMDELQSLITSLDRPISAAAGPRPAQRSQAAFELFLPVTSDLVLELGEQGKAPTLLALLRQYERISGQVLLMSDEVRALLSADSAGIDLALNVPKETVQTFVERLLVARGYYLIPSLGLRPHVVEIVSTRGSERTKLLTHALVLEAAEVAGFAAEHPGVALRCTFTMNSTDVRQLANSLRVLFGDQTGGFMVPAGSTNSLILGGDASAVASTLRTLQSIDAACTPPSAQVIVEVGAAPAQ